MNDETTTRDRLLDAAEALFAEQGVSETSLRELTRLAKANLASVSYYFGSKEGLAAAIVQRRIVPLNDERLALLKALTDAESTSLEAILTTFFRPAFRMRKEAGVDFTQVASFIQRSASLPAVRQLLHEEWHRLSDPYVDALRRALPQLSKHEAITKFQLSLGAMIFQLRNWDLMEQIRGGSLDEEVLLEELLRFCVGGFRTQWVAQETP